MSRNISLAPDEFYHLYNRGTEKRDIFLTEADRERFLALLYFSNAEESVHISNIQKYQGRTLIELLSTIDQGETLIDICAYCLMPNHFHLLVREKKDGGISRFMQKLMTGYTMYFNKRYERSGALFQGKYKAAHAGDDRYLKYLVSYIHLNPVKLIEPRWKETGIRDRKTAKKFLHAYRYSSYPDYLKLQRGEEKIIIKDALPDYFSDARDFEDDIADWLDYHKDS
ncbi:transposase [Patescibacteria group bacterium]|nr:transposase [Patescibacteria group bacterium]